MAKTTKEFVVVSEGKEVVVGTIGEVKKLIGNSRVTIKQVEAGNVENVFVREVEEEQATLALTNEEDTALTDTHVEDTATEEVAPTVEAPAKAEVAEDTEEVDFPEVGHYSEQKALKKFIKGLSNEQVAEWVELEGLEVKQYDNEAIQRMRNAMAINALHFPNSVRKSTPKQESPYKKYTTEELVQMALDNDIEVKDAKGDARIERMYTIMALRNAGIAL
ncbi:hypothetical protein EalM132_00173 [Exiguobacterium phage vB_EalM-132]|nr:hypothetical protein EalM132_00003 [Exiguobacterium phage vB_EalM-132]AYP68685.1 hypothetical protein EalM132_00173 [Exiguobacterium phage vB_EalM-132]